MSLPVRPEDLLEFKKGGRRISALTAYDYPTARLLDEAGIDLLLVGDSLGMVVLGMPDTTSVTLADIVHHTRPVARATQRALVVADLPIGSYEHPEAAVNSALELIEAGARAVKLEGALIEEIEAIISHGVPLIAHLGMLPQHVLEEGAYRRKGKTPADANRLLQEAFAVEKAGASAVVLECVMPEVARAITAALGIPTIGIGSGPDCDGQILVVHDLIGSFPWFRPKFAITKSDVAGEIRRAAEAFKADVSRPK